MSVLSSSHEKELLSQIANGDQLAFNALFDAYRPTIYSTALKLTGDASTAEEILQDTFLKVWLKREELPGIDNFAGWLYTIARNYTYNALKNAKRDRENLLNLTRQSLLYEAPAADHAMREREFEAILRQAVARLPEKQRQTYLLIKEQQRKRNEVAGELNVSPETVKWNLEQAMKSIRAYCLAHLDDAPKVMVLYFFSKFL